MLKGMQILDADCHVVEPLEMWQSYIEPEFRERVPRKDLERSEQSLIKRLRSLNLKATLPNPMSGVTVEGEQIFNKISEEVWVEGTWQMAKNYTVSALRNFDPPSQVRALKHMGVDLSFLYPTVGLWMFSIDSMEPALAGALVRAYNNWIRDFVNYDNKLFRGVGAISRHDPEDMVSELRRVASFGFKAVFLRPNPVKGRLLSDPSHEPFWTECENLDIAVGIHEGTHARVPSTGADRFSTRFAMHACSHPMEQMMAMLTLIEGGVLERHPKLRVAFLEAGCGWLPYWLWRLDELEYKNLAWEVKDNVKIKPSEYFRRQCFIAVEPDEPYLPELLNFIGEDNILFGTDYPHMDHGPSIMDDVSNLRKTLPSRVLQKILWENAMRFYGLS
jgi:predicted TIM-barrel fold metal-dependent hydrolase